MPVIQQILIYLIIVAFIIVSFVLAWYMAIPLLIIWLVLGGIRWMKERWLAYRIYRDSNGCVIRRTRPQQRTPEISVIDVDYTEIK